MRMKKTEFAALCKITRKTVHAHIRSGKLIQGPEGLLDTDDAAIRDYIADRGITPPPLSAQAQEAALRERAGRSLYDMTIPDLSPEELTALKIQADILDKKEATKAKILAYRKNSGTLIPRDMAEYLYTSFLSRIATDFLRMPKKLKTPIENFVKNGDAAGIFNLLETEITIIIQEAKRAQKEAVKNDS